MRHLALILICLALTACDDEASVVTVPSTDPATAADPQIVVVLGTDAASTLGPGVMDDSLISFLRYAGYDLLSIDLPCHPGVSPLYCWRTTLESGDHAMFLLFCFELSRELTRRGITNAAVIGQSRGGYVAVTCAAIDKRFTKIVLLKPVTDLQRLSEFDGCLVDQRLFGLGHYRPVLEGRSVSILIGANDDRVDTGAAISFATQVGAEIELTDSPGHLLPGNGLTAAWVLARLDH